MLWSDHAGHRGADRRVTGLIVARPVLGVDFDNTIVSYDCLFHRVAAERGLIPASLVATKGAVRDYLRRSSRLQRTAAGALPQSGC